MHVGIYAVLACLVTLMARVVIACMYVGKGPSMDMLLRFGNLIISGFKEPSLM
jgi:hypothetical protein